MPKKSNQNIDNPVSSLEDTRASKHARYDAVSSSHALQESAKLKVSVCMISGTTEHLEMEANATVLDLRKRIAELGLGSVPTQQLLVDNEVVHNTAMLSELPSLEVTLCIAETKGISSIELKSGDVMDYIRLVRRDGTSSVCGRGGGSHRAPFLLEPHEHLTEVSWQRKDYYGSQCVNAMVFRTSTGRSSDVYGTQTMHGKWHALGVMDGDEIVNLKMVEDHRGYISNVTRTVDNRDDPDSESDEDDDSSESDEDDDSEDWMIGTVLSDPAQP